MQETVEFLKAETIILIEHLIRDAITKALELFHGDWPQAEELFANTYRIVKKTMGNINIRIPEVTEVETSGVLKLLDLIQSICRKKSQEPKRSSMERIHHVKLAARIPKPKITIGQNQIETDNRSRSERGVEQRMHNSGRIDTQNFRSQAEDELSMLKFGKRTKADSDNQLTRSNICSKVNPNDMEYISNTPYQSPFPPQSKFLDKKYNLKMPYSKNMSIQISDPTSPNVISSNIQISINPFVTYERFGGLSSTDEFLVALKRNEKERLKKLADTHQSSTQGFHSQNIAVLETVNNLDPTEVSTKSITDAQDRKKS